MSTRDTSTVHVAIETVSLKTEACERLRSARRYPSESFSYGHAFRFLQANGLLIGANDLWIAAAGLAHGIPVVSRNARHFERVPGLSVVSYT